MGETSEQQDFEQLYIDYQLRLTAYARRFVNDVSEAQDLVQDCFLNLWNRSTPVDRQQAPMLLFVMVRNRCLDYLKHKKSVDKYALCYRSKIRGEERLYNYDFALSDTERTYLYEELERQIQTILDTLPERCREVFILSRFQGLKNREIAALLQISLQAVEKHIQKALRIFTDALSKNESLYLKIVIISWLMASNN
jgi:RNA polymerase sigma-70 factor (family 1)